MCEKEKLQSVVEGHPLDMSKMKKVELDTMLEKGYQDAIAGRHYDADEVFDDVQQALFFKHSLKERIKLSVLRIFIAAVFCFPFHEAILTGSDGSGLAGQMIADDADAVINKH